MKGIALSLVLAAGVAHLAHRAMDAHPPPVSDDPQEVYPSIEALKLMSLGYPSLLADYYWLQAVYHFGDNRMHRHNYPNLLALVRRVVALDPYFVGGYLFAGTALTLKGMDPRPSVELLEQGVEYRPEIWQIGFFLGFNRYHFLGDYAGAAEALSRAATLPEVPPYVGPLATRVASEAGQPELGLTLIDRLLATVQEPELRQSYEERRARLLLTYHLKHLNAAVERYQHQRGEPPQNLAQLVTAGLLPSLPQDPYGGTYLLGPAGQVVSSSGVTPLGIEDQGIEDKTPALSPPRGDEHRSAP